MAEEIWWDLDGSLKRKDGTYGLKPRGKSVERNVRVKAAALERWENKVRNGAQVRLKKNPDKDDVLDVGDVLDVRI